MGLSLQAIQLIAGFIAAILHGIYLVTCVPGVRCLLWDTQHHKLRSLKAIHWTLTLASLTIFITNLLSLCLGMYRSVVVVMVATDPSSATRPVSNWVNLVKSICTYITIGVADGILIYRCWIVYYRQYYVIVLPILLWLADTACAAVLIWMQDTINAKSLVNVAKIQPLLKAFTALTIPVNVIATSMIVYRIWSVDHANAKFRTSTRASALRNVIRIIMESGLIYTASAIGTFGCYLAGSNAFYIGTSIQVPMAGIAMNLILIRAHKQSSIDASTGPPNATPLVFGTRETDQGSTVSRGHHVDEKQIMEINATV